MIYNLLCQKNTENIYDEKLREIIKEIEKKRVIKEHVKVDPEIYQRLSKPKHPINIQKLNILQSIEKPIFPLICIQGNQTYREKVLNTQKAETRTQENSSDSSSNNSCVELPVENRHFLNIKTMNIFENKKQNKYQGEKNKVQTYYFQPLKQNKLTCSRKETITSPLAQNWQLMVQVNEDQINFVNQISLKNGINREKGVSNTQDSSKRGEFKTVKIKQITPDITARGKVYSNQFSQSSPLRKLKKYNLLRLQEKARKEEREAFNFFNFQNNNRVIYTESNLPNDNRLVKSRQIETRKKEKCQKNQFI